MHKRLHYATQLYMPSDSNVYNHLTEGLKHNLQLPYLTEATVFLDNCEPPFEDPRVNWIPRKGRASFSDFLKLADTNTRPVDKHGATTHLLFSNSDIVFNEGIKELVSVLSEPAWAACLTRREIDGSFPVGIDPLQSQDAWLLRRQPLAESLIEQMKGVRLGIAGCEHVLAAALVAHGFDLWNPCEDCLAFHTDSAPRTHYPMGDRYWGLYAYVPSCRVQDLGRKYPSIRFAYARAPGRYYDVKLD